MKRTGKIMGLLAILFLGLALLAACAKSEPATTSAPAPTTTVSPATTSAGPAPITTTAPKPSTQTTTPPPPAPATVALGGKLYDSWLKTAQIATPKENSPLWATQTTNTRTGADTWRCKECHGWDYMGKDGAYGKGSHVTGFPGVYGAATTKTTAELKNILKGSANPKHDFSTYLKEEQISALAAFLKAGAVIDETQYIDYATKKPKSADTAKGKQLYESNCTSCHGADGKLILFGGKDSLGFLANDNPWETLHKIRFGQPGAPMPSGTEQQWSIKDMVDMLSYSQTLPQK